VPPCRSAVYRLVRVGPRTFCIHPIIYQPMFARRFANAGVARPIARRFLGTAEPVAAAAAAAEHSAFVNAADQGAAKLARQHPWELYALWIGIGSAVTAAAVLCAEKYHEPTLEELRQENPAVELKFGKTAW
jgi:hypothetical protein